MSRLAPLKSIRKYCLECMGDSPGLVRDCIDKDCSLHLYRHGNNPSSGRVLKAIRNQCLNCAETKTEIRNCNSDCYLKPYRMGTNPNRRHVKRSE